MKKKTKYDFIDFKFHIYSISYLFIFQFEIFLKLTQLIIFKLLLSYYNSQIMIHYYFHLNLLESNEQIYFLLKLQKKILLLIFYLLFLFSRNDI